jgi:hypothetical protein
VDHQKIIAKGLLAEKKEKLAQLVIKNDRLVKDLLVNLSRWSDDDIHSISTAAVLQAAHELDDNQRQAQALERTIKEAESG